MTMVYLRNLLSISNSAGLRIRVQVLSTTKQIGKENDKKRDEDIIE
jgi:hypothetical protein